MSGGLLVIMSALAVGWADDPAPAAGDRAAYEAASRGAGKDAGAQVRLALWCEARGMTALRMKHLAAAVLNDPSNALARGLMGLVSFEGKWERPDDVSREAKDDPGRKALMEEYLRRRARAGEKADDQWKLATWCDQNELKEQAVAHYHAVLRLDPRRDAAWKRLGFKKAGGRWIKPEWQAAAKRESDEQERANKHWRPILERLRSGLASRDKRRREGAEAELAQVTDPRAVPMVWAIFVTRGAAGQKVAVQVLGQIDAPGSTRALTMLALSSASPEARRQAVQTLRLRDPRDFAPMLVALIRDPIKYEVKATAGPGKPGELVIHDGTTKRDRIYTPLSEPYIPIGPGDMVAIGADGLPVLDRLLGIGSVGMAPTPANVGAAYGLVPPGYGAQAAARLEKNGMPAALSQQIGQAFPGMSPAQYQSQVNSLSRGLGIPASGGGELYVSYARYAQIPIGEMELDAMRSAEIARLQLAGDVRAIEAYNAPIRETNRRVREVLSPTVGVDEGDDRKAWSKWLVDLFGYAIAAQQSASEETTVVEQVPVAYQPQASAPVVFNQEIGVRWQHSCFGPGTPVRTLDGLRPIESLRPGDLVLTQDAGTGTLEYRAIVEAYHNPPNSTHRVALDDGNTIVATGIHRLWKAGKGWAMVRELKPGDVLRTLGGTATVKSVEADRTQPVFNLRVAGGESYFVGNSGVLAHDNSTIDPVPEPFDAVVPLTSVTSPSSPSSPRRSMLGR